AATRWWQFAAAGAAVLATYLVLLLSAVWRFRDCPVAVGVIDGLLRRARDRQFWVATAFTAGGHAAPVAVPAAPARAITATGRAAAPPVEAGPRAPAGQWPTPSLRRVVAGAAERAQAAGRPVAARDVWHALLTDPDAECHLILDALGLDPDDLLRVLT